MPVLAGSIDTRGTREILKSVDWLATDIPVLEPGKPVSNLMISNLYSIVLSGGTGNRMIMME